MYNTGVAPYILASCSCFVGGQSTTDFETKEVQKRPILYGFLRENTQTIVGAVSFHGLLF